MSHLVRVILLTKHLSLWIIACISASSSTSWSFFVYRWKTSQKRHRRMGFSCRLLVRLRDNNKMLNETFKEVRALQCTHTLLHEGHVNAWVRNPPPRKRTLKTEKPRLHIMWHDFNPRAVFYCKPQWFPTQRKQHLETNPACLKICRRAIWIYGRIFFFPPKQMDGLPIKVLESLE